MKYVYYIEIWYMYEYGFAFNLLSNHHRGHTLKLSRSTLPFSDKPLRLAASCSRRALPPSVLLVSWWWVVGELLHMDNFLDLDIPWYSLSSTRSIGSLESWKFYWKSSKLWCNKMGPQPPNPLSQWPSPSGNVAAPKGSSPELHWKIAWPLIVYSTRRTGAVPWLHIKHAYTDNNSTVMIHCSHDLWHTYGKPVRMSIHFQLVACIVCAYYYTNIQQYILGSETHRAYTLHNRFTAWGWKATKPKEWQCGSWRQANWTACWKTCQRCNLDLQMDGSGITGHEAFS